MPNDVVSLINYDQEKIIIICNKIMPILNNAPTRPKHFAKNTIHWNIFGKVQIIFTNHFN